MFEQQDSEKENLQLEIRLHLWLYNTSSLSVDDHNELNKEQLLNKKNVYFFIKGFPRPDIEKVTEQQLHGK